MHACIAKKQRGGGVVRYRIPMSWARAGLVLAREQDGPGSEVLGDPSIVWDEEIGSWRMFLFMAPPGHGQAVSDGTAAGPGAWRLLGPLRFTNPDCLLGGHTHKPYIVMEAGAANRAAYAGGRFWLLLVSSPGGKVVQRAWAERLAGPWTVEPGPLIPAGPGDAFDAKHTDAVSGLYFPDRSAFLYFYMGYPRSAQPGRQSPFGSAQGVAVQRLGEPLARKLGVVLPPAPQARHWAGGWVGGMQVLPGDPDRWIAVVNASPTAPDPADAAISREEPPPSLGGFAVTDEEWPVSGWRWAPSPIEWIEDIPAQARAAGEGVNLWRQHLLALPDGRLALLYNSGPYGREQLYMKVSAEVVRVP